MRLRYALLLFSTLLAVSLFATAAVAENDNAPYSECKTLYRSRDFAGAIQRCSEFIRAANDPVQRPKAILIRGLSYFNNLQFEPAIEDFDWVLNNGGSIGSNLLGEAYFFKGVALIQLDKPDEALAIFNALSRDKPFEAKFKYYQGEALYLKGDYFAASVSCEAARKYAQKEGNKEIQQKAETCVSWSQDRAKTDKKSQKLKDALNAFRRNDVKD